MWAVERFKSRDTGLPLPQKDSLRKGWGEASTDNREGSIGGGASLGPKVRECPPAGLESSTTPSWHVQDSREVKLVSWIAVILNSSWQVFNFSLSQPLVWEWYANNGYSAACKMCSISLCDLSINSEPGPPVTLGVVPGMTASAGSWFLPVCVWGSHFRAFLKISARGSCHNLWDRVYLWVLWRWVCRGELECITSRCIPGELGMGLNTSVGHNVGHTLPTSPCTGMHVVHMCTRGQTLMTHARCAHSQLHNDLF